MDLIKGSTRILYIQSETSVADFIPISCLTSDSFNEEVDFLNTTTRENNGWETSRPVTQRFAVDFEGMIVESEQDVTISYSDLVSIKRDRTLKSWRLGTIDGKFMHEFQAYISNIGDSAVVGEFLSFSVSLVGWGEPAFNEVFTEHFDYKFDFKLG